MIRIKFVGSAFIIGIYQMARFPGRCPGLLYVAPSELKRLPRTRVATNDSSIFIIEGLRLYSILVAPTD